MDEFEVGMPLLGDKAPSFEAQTTHGKIRFPSLPISWSKRKKEPRKYN